MKDDCSSNILSIDDFENQALTISPENWTVIIPAAGIGSRLGYNKPKILYPILAKPILYWLFEALEGLVENVILVLSPKGQVEVERFLKNSSKTNYSMVVQDSPQGMAAAIHLCHDNVSTSNVMVLWGDQVTVKSETLQACLHTHENRESAKVTLPTVKKKHPYIHFERDRDGKIIKVLEAREAPIPYSTGESDCGVFFFNTKILFEMLDRAREKKSGIGGATKEFNLLPLIPYFDQQIRDVVSIRIKNEEEAFGINTTEEAKLVAQILSKRK
jgi:bifunctional UDP-N-acetylglucosamine pyrophosphorylase / glucosamine-1-phosphate N-acetyltransferase